MNEKIKNGGLAFPLMGMDYRNGQQFQVVHQGGMTLRDYFAAKAMQAHIAIDLNLNPEEIARWAYRYADAMLVERERGDE